MSCARCAVFFFFFFNDTATPEIYPLPLHAALPIPQPPMLLTSRAPRRITPPCSISFWVFVRIALSCMSVRPNTEAALSIRGQFTSVPPPIAVRAARLFKQPHLLDFHPPVHRLHHVVDGEQGDGHRRERLHLHSRPPDRLGGGTDPHARERRWR